MRNLRSCSCGAGPNELHVHGCDVERCSECGFQLIMCNCIYRVCGMDPDRLEEEHPNIYRHGPTFEMERAWDAHVESTGGRVPWSGEWPGALECREFGFWSKWVEGRGWVECGPGEAGASESLNKLTYEACYGKIKWDKQRKRWVK